ncbi:hypothetical protein ACMA1D_20230 [Streptomyces sp. 796.1]|uniref:hypothetical protein n=1 Tax=Streptomyces sp. 796.1 TaxID=3163029 RepID=UPI0039C97F4A
MDHERPPAVVHHPIPLPPHPAPLAPIQPATAPALSSVQLPDGHIVTGYTLTPHPHPAPVPEPVEPRPVISRTAINIALGGIGFGAICGGLVLLTTFIAALAALIQQLIILAAVIFGGWIATQALRHRPTRRGTTVNIRKAVIKRNHFHT